ncbi:ammonium transporter [Rhizobium sp. CG4]|jgi:Amt family ammonium transporter|uniref:ammonium transporter n=1 Tax=Rhizobium/Agrobacterium group TaxID=227290 RepID=UPI0017821640|nr:MULTISPECIES: ammonium transporter [Rhizobium/Agrobacterium group]MBD9389492.1 ammonium transporter [Agrobacterium sp. AGB01]MCM2456940.1 ammonium transporter [Rhizobium sp. CG4]MCS4244887.1 Amt family ammonium transporter [Rhizobium sp. BIGb0125]MDO5893879.1 ammonium transporter [Agrobacterium sp. Azo12]
MSFSRISTSLGRLGAGTAALLAPAFAFAQEAAAPAAEAAAAAPTIDSGDTAWMLTSTVLVLFMILPGLALFYGGLVRSKNMLSVLMQCLVVSAAIMIVWVFYGYSLAFSNGGGLNTFIGGFEKLFLSGVTSESVSGSIPEYVFISFQLTFACITPALIVGAFAERIKFSAVILFCILWVTFVYFPVAHMVWSGDGALMWDWGALDFAGGTVVHINAGVAGLIGAILVGKRTGFGKDMMAPHSMTLTMVGASMLWVGWFGFNAGSAAAANGVAGLAMINTLTATAGAIVAWCVIESFARGKASMLGAASGVIAGLVAVTPAAGAVGPIGAIFLGAIASAFCYFFVSVVKNKFGYDDTADVFGVHGVGGIVGAIGTGIFASTSLGGVGYAEGVTMGAQVWVQIKSVILTIVWCGIGSFVLYKLVDLIVGLRVPVEAEREGLDLASHGEAAYHN